MLKGEPRLATYKATYGVPVVLVVVVRTWVDVRSVEVQVVRVVTIVHSRGPIVAVRAAVVRRRAVPVAGEQEAGVVKRRDRSGQHDQELNATDESML